MNTPLTMIAGYAHLLDRAINRWSAPADSEPETMLVGLEAIEAALGCGRGWFSEQSGRHRAMVAGASLPT